MQLIRAILRNDFDLRAAVATVFGGVAGRGDAHLLDRFLIRRDDRPAAPTQTVDADAVDREVVGRDALPVGADRDYILHLKDRNAGAARSRRVRQIDCAAAARARALSEDARREPRQFVRIAPELRQVA